MSQAEGTIAWRQAADKIGILDIRGEITTSAEESLKAAYEQANSHGAQVIALNFSDLKSIDSFGIGLLIRLLTDARRQNQRPVAYGLPEPYRQVFELTQLDEALELYSNEDELLRSVAG